MQGQIFSWGRTISERNCILPQLNNALAWRLSCQSSKNWLQSHLFSHSISRCDRLQRVSVFLRVTIKEVCSGLTQLLTTSCFFEEWIFSQFGHNFLKCASCVSPGRLCVLRANAKKRGLLKRLQGAITALHCVSLLPVRSHLRTPDVEVCMHARSHLLRHTRISIRRVFERDGETEQIERALYFLRRLCCVRRKLIHHPPFWPHAVTFLFSWTAAHENCARIVSRSLHLHLCFV